MILIVEGSIGAGVEVEAGAVLGSSTAFSSFFTDVFSFPPLATLVSLRTSY